jgi:hypothetical protein
MSRVLFRQNGLIPGTNACCIDFGYDQSLLFNINICIEKNVLIFVRSLASSGFVRVFALCLARENSNVKLQTIIYLNWPKMGHEMERVLYLMFFFLLICKKTFRKIQIIYRHFKALSTISSRLLLIYEKWDKKTTSLLSRLGSVQVLCHKKGILVHLL